MAKMDTDREEEEKLIEQIEKEMNEQVVLSYALFL